MDYYKTLGVNRNASQSDIKRAFKKQAMKHHPDKGGDPKQFQQLNEAYEVLGNEQKKRQYDMFGTTNQQPGGARTWEFRTDSFPDDIGDVFNQFFGPIWERKYINNIEYQLLTKKKKKSFVLIE